jgi:Cu(I)/Ag(I) efflux system membrane fusion protein
MKRTTLIAIIAGLLLGIGGTLAYMHFIVHSSGHAAGEHAPETSGDYYTCPMHPSVRSDRPGACPVCGMALVKKSARVDDAGAIPADFAGVALSPTQRVMANIRTAPVQRRSLAREISAVGLINYAEPNFLHISARFPGRLEKLYLTYPGQRVKKGDPVADVYSPEAISAQQEFLIALDWSERARSGGQFVSASGPDLLEQARKKLILWGFTEEQIERLQSTRSVEYVVTIYSPISGTILKRNVDPQHYMMTGEDMYDVADLSIVWVYLDVYEQDIRFLSAGQRVDVLTKAYPGEAFAGKVTFIEPLLDPETRTVRVRTEFPNAHGRLKPNMYVTATIRMPALSAIAVPTSAVISTGRRNVVWVEVHENAFEPRDVVLGTRSGQFVEVISGVHEGELVAETGGYLIDSEAALQGPGAADPHAGHGAMTTAGQPDAKNEVTIVVKGNYTPNVIHLKKGVPVKLNFQRDEDARCSDEIVIKDFGIHQKLPAWKTTTIELTPDRAGEFQFACGMDMLHGKIVVRE